MNDKSLKELIKQKNDWLRHQLPDLPKPHRLSLSSDCGELADEEIMEVLLLIKNYKSFSDENDPYSEHDFGKVEYKGETYYWKFDYYDDQLQFHQTNGTRILAVFTPFEA